MKRCINLILTALIILVAVSCTPKRNQPFSFAFLTDTHIGTSSGAEDLRTSINDINRIDSIDFVIVAGDLTEYDFAGELDTVKNILDRLTVPYYAIPGNHELKWSASGGEKFRKIFGDDKFVFTHNGYKFIGINQGPLMRMGEGFVAREDLNWMKRILRKIPARRPYFIVTHYPVNHTVTNAYEFLEIAKKKNIQGIFHGHGHANRRTDYSDVTGIMGRSNLSRGVPAGYNIVTVKNDRMTWRERRPAKNLTMDAWTVLDIEPFEYTDSHKELLPDLSINNDYPSITESWQYDSEYSITAAPAFVDGKVIFGNRSGKITALSAEDGSIEWQTMTGGPIFTTPAIDSTLVLVTSADSSLYCLDYRTGDVVWTYKTGAPIVAHPAISNKKIYMGGSDGKFRCIDLRTGKLEWDLMGIQSYVETKPLITDNKVIFGAWDSRLYALDAKHGHLKWVWKGERSGKLYSPAVVHPVYSDGKVFIVAPDRVMTAIDIESGETVWRTSEYKVRENIGISEDGSKVYAKNMWDIVNAMSATAEEPVTEWAVDLGFGFEIDPSYPVESNGNLYFTTQFGFVYSLNADNGELKWIHRLGGNLLNTPVVQENNVFLTGMDGKVTKIKINE